MVSSKIVTANQNASAREQTKNPPIKEALQCAAFSPYVGKLNPDYGGQPSKELINELLDKLIKETPFRWSGFLLKTKIRLRITINAVYNLRL